MKYRRAYPDLLLGMALLLYGTAYAQNAAAPSGPLILDAVARKGNVSFYSDSTGSTKSGSIPESDLAFPMNVIERTPEGMVRITVKGADHWVQLEDFKSKRAARATCLVAAKKELGGADRGANEECAKTPKR